MMKKLLAAPLVFFQLLMIPAFCHAQAPGQAPKSDNPMRSHIDSLVDARVRKYFNDQKSVGLSMALVIGGKPAYYNYGETSHGNGRLPSASTYYEIGSMTKTFTGILLAQAVLDGKIDLGEDIRKYLRGDYPNLSYKGTPITIQDLSNHTSRITRIFPNLWERETYMEANPYGNYTRELLLQGLQQMKVDTMPGKIYSYSNMAVGLLGCIEEEAYHKKYFELISRYILAPLKMNATRIDLSGIGPEQIAYPHDAARKVVPFWELPELPALGALRSTTTDMVKYILANNASSNPAIALSHKITFGSKQEGMGLNWFIHSTPQGYQVIEHSGGTGGSRSSLQCIPQLNAGFILLTNSLANRNGLEKELLELVSTSTNR